MMKFLVLLSCVLIAGGCSKFENAKGDAAKSDGKSTNGAAAQQNVPPIELKVKWPMGNRYTERLQVTSSSETTVPQSPKPIGQQVKIEQEYALEVTKQADKGKKEIDLEFLSTDLEVTSGGKVVMNIDTKGEAGGAEADNPLAASYRQLVGTKIKYHLNDRNMVEKIDGLKEFVDKAVGKAPAQAKAMMRTQFSDDYFKQLVEFGKSLPSKPVKPGDTWPVKTQIAMGAMGYVIADLNYTFKGMEQREKRDCAAIDFTGSLTSKPPSNTPPPTATSVTIEKGTMSGRTWFDPELGSMVDTDMDQDLTMKVSYSVPVRQRPAAGTNVPQPPAQAPVQQTATTHTKQKINIKLVDFSGTGK
jgi:hypothetical protein